MHCPKRMWTPQVNKMVGLEMRNQQAPKEDQLDEIKRRGGINTNIRKHILITVMPNIVE